MNTARQRWAEDVFNTGLTKQSREAEGPLPVVFSLWFQGIDMSRLMSLAGILARGGRTLTVMGVMMSMATRGVSS